MSSDERIRELESSLAEAKRLLKPFADMASQNVAREWSDNLGAIFFKVPPDRGPETIKATLRDFRAAARFLSQESSDGR